MSFGATFDKPIEETEGSPKPFGEPNDCNKIYMGTRLNVYLLAEHPHAYEIAYFDFIPSLIADTLLLPISAPYTGYLYANPPCNK